MKKEDLPNLTVVKPDQEALTEAPVVLVVPEQLKLKFKEHFSSIQKLKMQIASIEALLTESANSFIIGKLGRETTDEVYAFNQDFNLVEQGKKMPNN